MNERARLTVRNEPRGRETRMRRGGQTEGDGSVSSRAGCCIGQVRVACDSWPVARVAPAMERAPARR